MLRLLRKVPVFLFLVLILFNAGDLKAAAPAAGTLIENVAEATYFNTQLGIFERITSNVVRTTVAAVPQIDVEANQSLNVSRGELSQFVYSVENVGNIDLQAELRFDQLTTDNFNLNNVSIYHDANRNGSVDNNEPALTIGTSFGVNGSVLPLAMGARINLIVRFQVPAAIAVGQIANTNLTLIDTTENVSDSATGSASVVTASLELRKSASLSSVKTGQELVYTIKLRNNSTSVVAPFFNIEGEQIFLDGLAKNAVLVRDAVPLNTTFSRIVEAVNFQAVYHLRGAALQTYVSALPADVSQIDAVAFILEVNYPVGFSTDLSFAVTANSNAGGQLISNVALTYQPNGVGAAEQVNSNLVETNITGQAGTIKYFDASFSTEQNYAVSGDNAFLQVDAGICNTSIAPDVINIYIRSEPTGDVEQVLATETGANTGVFRTGAVSILDQIPAVHFNGVLSAGKNETATATVKCADKNISADLIINKGGVVFNSITNVPLAGAIVQLIAQSNGNIIYTTTTDSDGFFTINNMLAGSYVLRVFPGDDYQAPSGKTAFPGFQRIIDTQQSFGLPFTISSAQPVFGVDIPVDPASQGAIFIEKTADKKKTRFGHFVTYTIKVKNNRGQQISQAHLLDDIPNGFAYINNTTRYEGVAVSDPAGAPGSRLDFNLASLGANATTTLTYTLKVLPTAGFGDHINSARATGVLVGTGLTSTSNIARANVIIDERGGVFHKEGVLLGKVFLDCNDDRIQNGASEFGVPGVKIYSQEGISVVTDADGKFSFPNLKAQTHVLSVYRRTLPAGTKVSQARVRDAGKAGSRFVDLKRGEIRAEYFPLSGCSDKTLSDVASRSKIVARYVESENSQQHLSFAGDVQNSTNSNSQSATNSQVYASEEAQNGWASSNRTPRHERLVTIERTRLIEEEIKDYDNKLSFIDLKADDVLDTRSVSVRIKGNAQASLVLQVNGEDVGGARLGQHVVYKANGVQAKEYVALRLKPGANTLAIYERDPFGIKRTTKSITVYAAGAAARIQVFAPKTAAADPGSAVPIIVRVTDADGLPTRSPVEVTLRASKGKFDVRDIRDAEYGVQAFIDNGEATFDYIPPSIVGTHTLYISSSFGKTETKISLTPDLTDRIFVGYVEGALKFGNKGEKLFSQMDKKQLSSFDETLEGASGAVFLKGRIKGDALLTLRYKSDQDTDDKLFRDIDPHKFYPIYGDKSERGFDAQSRTNLFVKVEKGRSYIMYGDLQINPESDVIKLGGYSRTLTGAKAHIEYEMVTLNFFAAQTAKKQVVVEIPARGVSGPYALDIENIVLNSEVVELITRDRDQPAVVLSKKLLSRFTDYTLDYFGKSILFERPINSIDENLNRVAIRVTFENDGNGDKYWIYGGEARAQLTDQLAVGYREVRSDAETDSEDRRTIRSAYVENDFGEHGRFQAELAQSTNRLGKTGYGARGEYIYENKDSRMRVFAAKTQEGFEAPNSSVSAGREEGRVSVEHRINEDLRASGEAIVTNNIENGRVRYGIEGRAHYRVFDGLEASVGQRYVREKDQEDDGTSLISGIFGFVWTPEFLGGGAIKAEYEQDLGDRTHKRLSLGTSYPISNTLEVYGQSELSTTETGFFGLGDSNSAEFTTRAGVNYAWNENTKLFSEFRNKSGEMWDSGVATGIKTSWQAYPELKFTLSTERVQPISETFAGNSSVAIGSAYESGDGLVLIEGNVEWSLSDLDQQTWYSNFNGGYKIGNELTFMLQNRYGLTQGAGEERTRDRARFGSAYRPSGLNQLSLLAWYEFNLDDTSNLTEMDHIWSIGGEYAVDQSLRLRARYAGQYYQYASETLNAATFLQLGNMAVEFDVTEKLSLGLNGTLFFDADLENIHTGIGADVSYAVAENLIATIGYNYETISEDQIRDLSQSGFHARLKMKFDEDSWDIFDSISGFVN